ncbi:hypothetical protein BYT27DRAFT_7108150, partial [Phlegmacium glaucopus]
RLPPELLIEVLKRLHWQDILRVRRTCQYLYEASKARPLWVNIFESYTVSIMPPPISLERPIQMYTAQELEFSVLRWKSAQVGWDSDDGSPARQRNISIEEGPTSEYLVKGGRWLLVATSTGSVSYYDLDAQIPTVMPLISRQKAIATTLMSVDVDAESPYLRFNIALFLIASTCPSIHSVEISAEIWQVTLVLDHHQRGTGLSATLLASFPLDPNIDICPCLSLRGQFVAFSICTRSDLCYTVVVDWARANGTSLTYPMRILYPSLSYCTYFIFVLPGNALLVAFRDTIILYNLHSVKETTTVPTTSSAEVSVKPIWDTDIENLEDASVSEPFICVNSIRFVLYIGHVIYGLRIDYRDDTYNFLRMVTLTNQPCRLMPRYLSPTPAQGYHQAVTRDGDMVTLMLYTWPDEANYDKYKPSPKCLKKRFSWKSVYRVHIRMHIDEGSGRVVLSTSAGERLVLDFAQLTR